MDPISFNRIADHTFLSSFASKAIDEAGYMILLK